MSLLNQIYNQAGAATDFADIYAEQNNAGSGNGVWKTTTEVGRELVSKSAEMQFELINTVAGDGAGIIENVNSALELKKKSEKYDKMSDSEKKEFLGETLKLLSNDGIDTDELGKAVANAGDAYDKFAERMRVKGGGQPDEGNVKLTIKDTDKQTPATTVIIKDYNNGSTKVVRNNGSDITTTVKQNSTVRVTAIDQSGDKNTQTVKVGDQGVTISVTTTEKDAIAGSAGGNNGSSDGTGATGDETSATDQQSLLGDWISWGMYQSILTDDISIGAQTKWSALRFTDSRLYWWWTVGIGDSEGDETSFYVNLNDPERLYAWKIKGGDIYCMEDGDKDWRKYAGFAVSKDTLWLSGTSNDDRVYVRNRGRVRFVSE